MGHFRWIVFNLIPPPPFFLFFRLKKWKKDEMRVVEHYAKIKSKIYALIFFR